MKVAKRRTEIIRVLDGSKTPLTGTDLSKKFGVSRQIIVGDISALKEEGYKISSTHFGYVLKGLPLKSRVFKVKHASDKTGDELSLIVSMKGQVADVYVVHDVYGKISAPLNIYTEEHVKAFMDGVRSGKSSELMNITEGNHYHTVRAKTEEILDQIEAKLKAEGYLAE